MSHPAMKVKAQLGFAFGALVVVVLAVSGLSLRSLNEADRTFKNYVHGIDRQANLAEEMRDAVNRRAVAVRNEVLATAAGEANKERDLVLKADAEVQTRMAELQRMIGADTAVPAPTQALLADMVRIESVYGPVARDIVRLATEGQRDPAIAKINLECRPLLAQLTTKVGEFVVDAGRRAEALQLEADERFGHQRAVMVVACLVALALAIAAGVIIARRLSRALGAEPAELGLAAHRVAAGDLSPLSTSSLVTPDSVLASLAIMQNSLASIVAKVRSSSDSIATGSHQIAMGSSDLSNRTEQQASALQETAATMEELSATVRHNAENARQANQLAQGASTVAVQGGEVVSQVVTTMRTINDSSRRIADIIGVIDGIAFQTNILALNAAVEAARAGDQGRGFAVVASEVRNLAQRSAQAAREIKTLISESVTRVEEGTALVDRAGATMEEVVTSIKRVTDIVGEISAASSEQSNGVAQVGMAVTQMDQATQQNAALVEESAAAAQSLQQQARELVDAVALFKLPSDPAGLALPAAPLRLA